MIGIRYMHKQIVVHFVYYTTTFVDTVSARLNVSTVHSPQRGVTKRKPDVVRDCKVQFETYVEANDNEVITNDLKSRTTKYFTLGPSVDQQGSILYFNLINGIVVTRRTVKDMPQPNMFQDLVNMWGNQMRGKEFENCIELLDRKKEPFQMGKQRSR